MDIEAQKRMEGAMDGNGKRTGEGCRTGGQVRPACAARFRRMATMLTVEGMENGPMTVYLAEPADKTTAS